MIHAASRVGFVVLQRALAIALVSLAARAQSIVVASDDFSGPTLDTLKWTPIVDGIPGASVVQNAGQVTLANKGYLRTNAEVVPSMSGGVRVRGRWKFETIAGVGVLEVLTRTDAVPTGFYHEAANGLAFNLWLGPSYPGVPRIQPRGAYVQVGPEVVTGALTWTPGAWYEFEAYDSVNSATWTVREEGQPANAVHFTCPIFSSGSPVNYVAIHGREYIGGPSICGLDDFSIEVPDCNGNQVPDGVDITAGAVDCNGNFIPDACEVVQDPQLDLNSNGVLDTCECLSTTYCVGAPNSTGAGARIGYGGTLSIGLNNLSLVCTGLPPNSSGLFFYGTTQIQAPFGNGYRCVGGSSFRTGITVAGPAGLASRSLNYLMLPPGGQITAGSTWNFQYWYRNPAAGGAGFNLSDGLHATFCP